MLRYYIILYYTILYYIKLYYYFIVLYYMLLYFIDDNVIFVFACFHVKRDPKQWKRRL
jgi:hypothetical protein